MRNRCEEPNGNSDTRTPLMRQLVTTVAIVSVAVFLLVATVMPSRANVFGQLGKLYGCVVTWGIVCDMSKTVTGTAPVPQPITLTCGKPVLINTPLPNNMPSQSNRRLSAINALRQNITIMRVTEPSLKGHPQFLSWPKGSAKYRFQGTCSSPARPGALMTVRWEGSWTPSEAKTDRPNASETLEITGYEPFLADRAPGGKIFMYWTARCTRDPWLQSPACNPFGAYVPDDLRQALPDIDSQSFPRTASVISAADKRRLNAEYQQVNPSYFATMGIEPRPLSESLKQTVVPPTGIVQKPLSQTLQQAAAPPSGIVQQPSSQLKSIFSRGTEAGGDAVRDAASVPSSEEGADDSLITPPGVITLDQPLHFQSVTGDDMLIAVGVYEIEPVLDLQLSLAREGQDTLFLPAIQDTHNESVQQSVAMLVSGQSDTRHLIFLTPDGKRFEAVGSTTGVKSRGLEMALALPTSRIRDAIALNSTASSAGASGPQPCLENKSGIGPRWLPPGCKMPSFPGGFPGGIPGGPPPPPYLDGSNVLHACVNNGTGAFRLVRPLDACTPNGEVKVKWQIVP